MTGTVGETSGTSITEETYFVFYGDHDKGSPRGFMVREGIESAERTAARMTECGYQFTKVRHADSLSELFGM